VPDCRKTRTFNPSDGRPYFSNVLCRSVRFCGFVEVNPSILVYNRKLLHETWMTAMGPPLFSPSLKYFRYLWEAPTP
jgi:hypothetical protein